MPRSSTSRGITPTPHLQLTWSRRSSRMPSVFTTCWETYGSGSQIGMVRTMLQIRLTPRALESGGFEWGAEAPGTTAHRLPALRAAAPTAAAAVPPATVSGAPPIEPFREEKPFHRVKGNLRFPLTITYHEECGNGYVSSFPRSFTTNGIRADYVNVVNVPRFAAIGMLSLHIPLIFYAALQHGFISPPTPSVLLQHTSCPLTYSCRNMQNVRDKRDKPPRTQCLFA
jgi:hypothetical protein